MDYLNFFSLHGNWVDFVILIILIYFVTEAVRYGFWVILADFVSFLLSLVFALKGYGFVSDLLRSNFSLPHSLSNAFGFLIVAGVSESILGFVFLRIVRKIPLRFWKSPWSNLASIFPALGQGLILTSFFLTLALGLPILPKIKADISESRIGGFLVRNTSNFEVKLSDIFGGLVEDSLTYLTIQPKSNESIPIEVGDSRLTVDVNSERKMFEMVNQERKKYGVAELIWREELVPVARAHAKDMWERKYFGHISPEGEDIRDRLNKAGVEYTLAGENLALAPTLLTAHTGLMNSEGHRENILDVRFKRIGIGVVDNGIYGKMFVQIFTD